MAIPALDKLSAPLVDSYMTYDYLHHRYIPLVDGIMKDAYVNLIVDWKTKENAQSYLDLLSRVIYETIISFKDQKYRMKMLYYMAHSKQARQTIQDIFLDQVWYNRRDGGFMLAYNSGVNMNQGKLIELGIDKALSPIAKQQVLNTYLGTRILPVDINDNETFTTLELLLAYLVAQGLITSDESDVVTASEDLEDLPYHEDYDVILLDSGSYLYRDLTTMATAISQMKLYDNANGTW